MTIALKKERDFDAQLEALRRKKEVYDKKAEIRELKRSMRICKPTTTTKVLMRFILINCSIVELYSMAVMYLLADLSALYALITAVVTESISFAVYCAKAYNETKQEEQVKLEREKMLLAHAAPAADEAENEVEAVG